MTALSRVEYIGNGTTQDFVVTFPYISRSHVYVTVNNNLLLPPLDYVWTSDNTIRVASIPKSGDVVVIGRATESASRLVDFQNGANLTEEELDLNTSQLLYLVQEIKDNYESKLASGLIRIGNGKNASIEEMIDAIAQEILNSALLTDLQQRISDIDLNAESILEQTLRLDGLDARIVRAEETVITQTTAFAKTLELLGAKNESNTAFVLNQNSVFVDPSTSLAARLSGLDSAVGDAHAAILAEETARTSADNALASSISTLQATVDGHTSSIQTLQNVVSGSNGLAAQYMVKTDVNGYVAGFGLYNTGATSNFVVLANRFAVVTPGQSPKVPFAVSGNTVYMQNVVINDALINSLTVSKLTQGTLNADVNVGTGRIIWNNGTFMKVVGVGFGTQNQFIEWFGPTRNINQCNEASAISYLKTNGDAYFGGRLHAGVLSNAATSTSLAANAEVVLGPYSTNGRPKVVTVSYSVSGVGGSTSPPSGTVSATLRLYRKIGTSAEVTVRTDTFSGGVQYNWDPNSNAYLYTFDGGGSYTLTENVSPTTADRTYRCAIISRTTPPGINQQRITITSVEE